MSDEPVNNIKNSKWHTLMDTDFKSRVRLFEYLIAINHWKRD